VQDLHATAGRWRKGGQRGAPPPGRHRPGPAGEHAPTGVSGSVPGSFPSTRRSARFRHGPTTAPCALPHGLSVVRPSAP